MNEPAKRTLGRYLADASLAGLALLLVKYFGPEPQEASTFRSNSDRLDRVGFNVEVIHNKLIRMADEIREDAYGHYKSLRILIIACTLTILLGLFAVGHFAQRNNYNTTPAPTNFNAMPPPTETPVVLFTRSGHWHKAVRDSLGVDRNYETWERINNATGWMKP